MKIREEEAEVEVAYPVHDIARLPGLKHLGCHGSRLAMAASTVNCVVTATQASDGNYAQGTASKTVTAATGSAIVTIGNLNQTFGATGPVTVTTQPAGLANTVSYTGIDGTTYAQSATPPTEPGTYSVVVTITDNVDYPVVTGNTGTETISQIASGLTVGIQSGTTNPSPYGVMAYFTISSSNSTSCPTGTVQFLLDGTPVAGATVDLAGNECPTPVSFYSIATIEPGTHSIVAQYAGDSHNTAGNSAPYSFTVSADTTAVTLSYSLSPINVGQPETFTATVSPQNTEASGANGLQGTVNFYDGTTLIDTETLPAASPYTVTFTTTALTEGPHSITATYVPGTDLEFSGSSSAVPIQVNYDALQLNWTAPASIVYGTALGDAQLNATATDPNTGETVTGAFTYTPLAGVVLGVGQTTLEVSFVPTGTETATYGTTPTTMSVQITVTGATLTVTANNQTMVYGGTVPPLTYTFSGFVNGDIPSQVTGEATCTIAGTTPYTVSGGPYPINCSLGTLVETNYTFTFVNGSPNGGMLTVTAATPTLSLLCPAATYDGNPHSCAGLAVGVDGSTQVAGPWTYSPGSETNAGSYPETGTFVSSDTDYGNGGSRNNGQATGTLVIGLATSSVTLTCPTSVIYTGSALTPCTASATGAGGLNVTNLTVTYSNNTNPGVATATASYGPDANHTASSNSADFSISSGAVLATAGSYSNAYDGNTHAPSACVVTGTTLLTCTNNPPSVGADVGTGTVTPVWVGNTSGFQLQTANGSWTITPATPTVTVSCAPGSFVYTGLPLTPPCTATVTGPGSPPQTVTWTYSNNINVGSPATATATFAGGGDYNGTSGSSTFTITPATAQVTISNTTQGYTGNPAPVTVTTSPTGLTVSVIYQGVSVTYGPVDVAPTNPGTYSVTATVINNPNYVGTATAQETIGEITPTLTLTLAPGSSNPSQYGAAVYFDLSLGTLNPCPTGTVTFLVNGTASGTTVNLTGSEGCSAVVFETATLDPASDTIQATYGGDSNYGSGTSNTLTQDVSSDTTEVTLAVSSTPINVGGSETFTATVSTTATLAAGDPGPAGTVQFYDNGAPLGAPVAVSTTSPYTATYTTTALPAGTNSISATYLPGSDNEFTGSSSSIDVVTVDLLVPTITWAQPAAITYGTALTESATASPTAQLDATASVPGNFVYTPAVGYVPAVGAVPLSVIFTPTDTTTYSKTTAGVTLTVNKATLTVTANNLTLSAGSTIPTLTATITGFVNNDPSTVVTGTASCTTTATSASPVGTYPITCTVGTLSAANYTFTFVSGTLTLNNKKTPTVSVWPTASAIYYGQTLASSVLNPVTAVVPTNASVDGAFAWTLSTIAPGAGTPSEPVTFTPTDTTDYNTVPGSVTVTVNKAVLTVTANNLTLTAGSTIPTLTATISGFVNGDTQATAVTGTASCTTTATSTSPAGTYPITCTAGTLAANNYTFTFVSGTLTLSGKATPTVSVWPIAGAITYGQTLASLTLNPVIAGVPGNASVAGAFAWTLSTIAPGAGTPSEPVTFTPTDTTDYNTVPGSVTVTVNKAVLTVTANNLTLGAGSTIPTLTATISGFVNGDTQATAVTGTASCTTTATSTSPAGTYPITCAVGTLAAANYTFTFVTGTLTLSGKTTPTVSLWPTAGAITYGQTLALSTLNPVTAVVPTNASVAGAFAWNTLTTVPPAGTPSEPVTFTPSDAADYNTVPGSVTVTVNKATLTVTANNLTLAAGSTIPTLTATITGFVNNDPSTVVTGTASCTTTATSTSPAGTYPITCTVGTLAAANYTFTFVSGTLTLNNKTTPTVSLWPTASAITYGQTLAALTLTPSVVTGTPNANASVPGTFAWTTSTTVPAAGTDPEGVTFTPTDTADYNTVPGSVTVTVNGGATATVTLGGLSQTYTGSPISATATTNPTGLTVTFTYSGSATAPTAAGSYTVVGTISDPSYQGTATGTLVIAQAPTTTSLSVSSGSITPGQSATLTATVASAATGAPTGTVNFYNGTTLLNATPVALTGGTATYTANAASLTAGTTYQLTAEYSGDTNFLASQTSSSSLIVVGGLDFTLTANAPASQAVNSGSMATYQLVVAPLYGIYPGSVSFTASGTPSGATVTFNPSTIAINGGQQTVTMTVQTVKVAKLESPSIGRKLAPLTLAFLLIPLLGARRLRRQGRRLSRLACLLLLLGCTLVGAMMTGCGAFIKSVEHTYGITVTATSGNMQHTAPVTLQVQ